MLSLSDVINSYFRRSPETSRNGRSEDVKPLLSWQTGNEPYISQTSEGSVVEKQ